MKVKNEIKFHSQLTFHFQAVYVAGMLTSIPFENRSFSLILLTYSKYTSRKKYIKRKRGNNALLALTFAILLGPNHSCLNTIDMKTFSTSVQKVYHFCSRYYYQDVHWRQLHVMLPPTLLRISPRPPTHRYLFKYKKKNERRINTFYSISPSSILTLTRIGGLV